MNVKLKKMPKIDKVFTLHVSVEKFLDACSITELIEVELLISSKRYQEKMNAVNKKKIIKALN
tara:strand:+ start:15051 stop:15239 length:189 start_codon:yes stop_codon:yes gene_type:complete